MNRPASNSLFLDPRISRRELLRRASNGFGALALTALLGRKSLAESHRSSLDPKAPHFQPRARNVIFFTSTAGQLPGVYANGPDGSTDLPGVPPGTYYLTTSAKVGLLVMYWNVKLDLKAGANAVTLDTRNAEPVK